SILLGVVVVSGTALIVLIIIYRRKQRELAWKRAMIAWGQSRSENRDNSNVASVRYLSANHLETFAAQLFRQMGYRVQLTGQSGDHGVDVRLVNPMGAVEVVQCKQWGRPVGEAEVRNLAGAMLHEQATRGYIIAPGGFSNSARAWGKGKGIILADEKEINRMIAIAYGNKRKK
ncbi:MAG TPA: restriction endonuclease, partial [Anaerolineaceae bacterium]